MIADPESPDAATEFPWWLMPCVVIFLLQLLSLLLPVTFFLCAGAGIDAGEGAFWDAA